MPIEVDVTQYGPVFAGWLPPDQIAPLGPGEPRGPHRAALQAVTVEEAFADQKIQDESMARACLSAVWLYHNFLDESHTISQGIDSPTGSYWHALMHRREPDDANAKHWFAKVGEHPIYPDLTSAAFHAAERTNLPPQAAFLRSQSRWNANHFVDLAAGARSGHVDAADLCRRIQHREFFLLFDYSYRQAIGG